MDDDLDEHEDGSTEGSSDRWSHEETSEDGTETLSVVPPPLDLGGTNSGDTDTSNGGDKRVGRRDVSRVSGTPHDPGGSTSKSASEGKHLNTGIATESRVWNNAVLDSICSSSADSDSTDYFENSTENHSLSVCYRTGRNRGGPSVGDIVGTVVEGVEEGKECADNKDVCKLVEHLEMILECASNVQVSR